MGNKIWSLGWQFAILQFAVLFGVSFMVELPGAWGFLGFIAVMASFGYAATRCLVEGFDRHLRLTLGLDDPITRDIP